MEERIFQASAREIASGKVLRWDYDWHASAMTRKQDCTEHVSMDVRRLIKHFLITTYAGPPPG